MTTATLTEPTATMSEPREPVVASLSQWQLIRRRFARHRLAVLSLRVLAVFYLCATFAEFFAPYPANDRRLEYAYCPPTPPRWNWKDGLHVRRLELHEDPVTLKKTYIEHAEDTVPLRFLARGEPYRLLGVIACARRFVGVDRGAIEADGDLSRFMPLGGDAYGRDILSRVIHGARVSLSIGLVSIVVAFLLGVGIGGASGYVGGRTDTVIQRVIEIINSVPQLPLWLAIAAVLPDTWSPLQVYFAITIVLSLLNWTGLARVVRGRMLALREEDFAVAARLIGAGHVRVVFRHLLPGMTSHIIVALTLGVPAMMLGETALSFLGLGLRPPVVSWGVLLQDCLNIQVAVNYPWLMLPALFIFVTVLAFNFVGDGLRDAADPYADR